MYSTNNPYGAGPSSQPIRRVPAQRQFVTIHRKPAVAPVPPPRNAVINITDSEPEINLIDSSDSEIELIKMTVASVTKRPSPVLPTKKPPVQEVIDLSMDEERVPSLSAVIEVQNDDMPVDTDSDSIPEGFEPWEPTVPLQITRTGPLAPMKQEAEEVPGRELAWRPPKMDWFREECTGASSAGAFIERGFRGLGRKDRIEMVPIDFEFMPPRRKRPRWITERSEIQPMRSALASLESDILFKDKIVPIPGMNAPRGAVNCIAQSKGYVAIGRTYEEDVAYDGGGLAIWKVRTKRAYDVPAHITQLRTTSAGPNALPLGRKQHSIGAIAFDPADNTMLLSAGDDNRIQLWYINEEEDKIEKVEARRVRKPSTVLFCPEGNTVAVGHADGLNLYDAGDALKLDYCWSYKQKGQEIVSIAWGVHRSKHVLAAGAQDDEGIKGRVVFIDTEAGKVIKGIDSESCSSLALDPSGTVLAFTGSGRGGKPHRHVLRLYDAHRTDWHPTAVIGIPSSNSSTSGEVIEAKWSPDGIHIAYARDDNTINVFDTRWLGQRETMLVFKHDADSAAAEGGNYGVQGIMWFGNDKLVSGGADHCVRVWDVRKEEESRVLATLGGRIGYLDGSEDVDLFPIVAGDQLGNAYYLPNRLLVDRS